MVIETALALVLVIGAALLIRTFVSLRTVEPGFESRGVLNVPMNFAVVPTKAGTRVSVLTGFVLRR